MFCSRADELGTFSTQLQMQLTSPVLFKYYVTGKILKSWREFREEAQLLLGSRKA